MIEKSIFFEYGDNNSEVLQLVHPSNFVKTAEYSQALVEFIKTLKEKVDKVYALVNALSAGEYYGSNRNGDYFPEDALKEYHKTFEALGHVYRHHVNKDPQQAMGRVVFSHYNPEMHRVELIIELDKTKSEDVTTRLDKGDLPAVSMGCFKSGTKIITEKFSKKNIEDVQVGDKIVTHTGKIRKVTELHPRDYSGKIYTINPVGKYRKSIQATREHPWLVIEVDKFYDRDNKHRLIRRKELSLEDAIWKISEELEDTDHLLIPKPIVENEVFVSNEKAKLLGWYLAEGYTHISGNGVQFTVEENDQILKEIDSTKVEYGIEEISIKVHKDCVKARNIIIYNKELKQDCLKYCGKYSDKKILHEEIFNWNREAKLTFLGAYLSGDGFFYNGQTYASSVNKELLEQLQWLGFSLGLISTVGKNEHRAGQGFSSEDTTEWILRFRNTANTILAPYCTKVINTISHGSGGNGGPFEYEEFYLLGIESIEEEFYEGPVYNFEVEEDNSYVVEQYAVHNCRVPWDECSICGNRARTRKEYCDHLAKQMNTVLSSGQRVVAINRMPKFFDLSVVLVPADRTAGILSKVAGFNKSSIFLNIDRTSELKLALEKTAEQDNYADIRKNIEAKIDTVSSDPKLLIRNSQARIPEEKLKKLAGYPLNEVMSTMLGLRIFPLKEDFQKLALYTLGEISLANDLEQKGETFKISSDTVPEVLNDVDFEYFNTKIAEVLLDEVPQMSMTKELIVTRVLTKMAEDTGTYFDPLEEQREMKVAPVSNYPQQVPPERSFISKIFFSHEPDPTTTAHKNPILPLGILGGLYYGFAKVFNNPSVSGFRSFMLKNKWLLPVLVGAGTVGSLFMQDRAFQKTAGVGIDRFIRNSFVSIPVSYYIAGVGENKARKGEPITETENFIRKHPVISGLIASLGLVQAEKILDKSFGLAKLGEFISRIDDAHLQQIYNDLIN